MTKPNEPKPSVQGSRMRISVCTLLFSLEFIEICRIELTSKQKSELECLGV